MQESGAGSLLSYSPKSKPRSFPCLNFGRIIPGMQSSDIAAYVFSLVALIGSAIVFVDQLVTGPNSWPLIVGLVLGFGGAGASVYAVKRRPFN